MARQFFLLILAFPLSVLAQTKLSNSTDGGQGLNLSVELPETGFSRVPSRAERLHAFEQLGQEIKIGSLDELDQDLLYLKKWKEGILKKRTKARSLHYVWPKTTEPSKFKKAIVFFDMNFAPAEIKAAEEAAKARGEEFILFPERTEFQQKEIEKNYRRQLSLYSELKKCQERSTQSCLPIEDQLKEVENRVRQVLREIKPINDLNAVFANIEARQMRPSVLIFSGHSGGGHAFSGVFGSLLADDVTKVLAEHPYLTEYLSSVLLWGCYTGTLSSLTEVWQKKLPSGIAVVGYRNRAPLGIRPSSGRLMKSYLSKENEFLTAEESKMAHRVFRSLDLVADLDATAIRGDTFFAYDRSELISEMLAKCDQFDPQLLEQYTCFLNGEPGCENPPTNHLGPLRQFYSYLQINRHCEDILRNKYPTVPTPEHVVRLIYIDNVKANFVSHHSHEFKSYNDYLAELNIPAVGAIENYIGSTRAMDMQRLQIVDAELIKLGIRDGSVFNRSNSQSIFKFSRANFNLKLVLDAYSKFLWIEPCTPFSWVESGSNELDRCEFGLFLQRPLSEMAKSELKYLYYNSLFYFWSKDYYHCVSMFYVNEINRAMIKNAVLDFLSIEIKELHKLVDRSSIEQGWLNRYQQTYAQVESLPVEQVIQMLLRDMQSMILKLDEIIKELQQSNQGFQGAGNLMAIKGRYESRMVQLQKLLINE